MSLACLFFFQNMCALAREARFEEMRGVVRGHEKLYNQREAFVLLPIGNRPPGKAVNTGLHRFQRNNPVT
jgi:hypothetical protein